MTEPRHPAYQGRDWATSRWKLAEAFDTLDHLHDLCLCDAWDEEWDEESDEQSFALLQAVHGLTETLSAQCRIAMADTIPSGEMTGNVPHRVACLETELFLEEIKARLCELAGENPLETISEIAFMVKGLKAKLKKLDS